MALGALTAAVRRLAGDGTPDEVPARAAADPADDSGVLVTEDQGRLPRKEPLGGVDVGAANASGVDVDHDLPGPGDGVGGRVDREPRFASPGRDLHASRYAVPARFPLASSSRPCCLAVSTAIGDQWTGPELEAPRMARREVSSAAAFRQRRMARGGTER